MLCGKYLPLSANGHTELYYLLLQSSLYELKITHIEEFYFQEDGLDIHFPVPSTKGK